MAPSNASLSTEERAELEALRAEKAAREQAEAAAAERAELNRLRAEREANEARALMEPDDDLNMPMPQKVLLAVLAIVLAFAVWRIFLAG